MAGSRLILEVGEDPCFDKQFNERSASVLNKAQYRSDVIALVVLWRLR